MYIYTNLIDRQISGVKYTILASWMYLKKNCYLEKLVSQFGYILILLHALCIEGQDP